MPQGIWVTHREMSEAIDNAIQPVRERAQAHDDWHLAQLQSKNKQFVANAWAALASLTAVAAVILTVVYHT